jgi:hypothetical protein
MNTLKTQWAIRAAIAAAGIACVLPTVAPHILPSANAAAPAENRIIPTTVAISAEQAARQAKVDALCAQIAGLNRVADSGAPTPQARLIP